MPLYSYQKDIIAVNHWEKTSEAKGCQRYVAHIQIKPRYGQVIVMNIMATSGVKMANHGYIILVISWNAKRGTDIFGGPLGPGKWNSLHQGVITLQHLHLHHRHQFLRQPPSVTRTSPQAPRWASTATGDPSNNRCVISKPLQGDAPPNYK